MKRCTYNKCWRQILILLLFSNIKYSFCVDGKIREHFESNRQTQQSNMSDEPEFILGHRIVNDPDDSEAGLSHILKEFRSKGVIVNTEIHLYNDANFLAFEYMIEDIAEIENGCLLEPLVTHGFLKQEWTTVEGFEADIQDITEGELRDRISQTLSDIDSIFKMIENFTRVKDSLETRYVKRLANCADALVLSYNCEVDKGVSQSLMQRYLNK